MPWKVQTIAKLHSFHMLQGNAQNPSSQASTVHELRTSGGTSWAYKRQRNQRSKCQHLLDYRNNERIPEKNIYFCFIDSVKAIDCVDHKKLWKIFKDMGIPDHLTCLMRNLYAGQEATVRTRHGTPGSKSGKENVKAVYCHPYLTYMQDTSCKMLGWMKLKLESRLLGEISITSVCPYDFIQHDNLQVLPCCYNWLYFLLFYR